MKINNKSTVIFFLVCYFIANFSVVRAEKDSVLFNKKRFYPLVGATTLVYTGALVGLDALWYKDYPRSSFHFFNDNHEWLQMDKFGHGLTAFQESRLGVDLLKWCGVSNKKAIVYGSLAGFIFQTPIEIMDGLSSEYGASVGDLIANTSGSLLVMTQYLMWNELRIQMKYSFHPTPYANIRPKTLGSNLAERALKDYNGQTYWACANVYSFLKKESRFPKWVNVAIGYGGENMLYGTLKENNLNGYQPYRQYYFSLDFDLMKIKTKSKFLKGLFYTLNLIHLPAPTLEVNKHGMKFHPIYF